VVEPAHSGGGLSSGSGAKRSRRPTDLAVSLAVLALLWSPILRTDGTPGGDGGRIMAFLSFARRAGGFVFWNSYRNGGYPLLADPEHFWLLSLIVDPKSANANLTLNAAIFALILLTAVPAWLIGRTLGLRPFWNVLFVLALGFNERMIWLQLNGRIDALCYNATLLVVIWNLLYRRLRPWNYLLISAAIGIAFAVSAHFAFVHCALVVSWFLFHDGAPWRRPLRKSLIAFGGAALVCMAGFALSGVWSIPLLGHFAESGSITSAVAYPPQGPDGVLGYARLLVPSVAVDIEYVSFLSLVLVPALLLARWARPAKIAPGGLGFDLVYVWGALFLLMSLPFIGSAVKAFYQMLPLAAGVRWFSPLEYVLRTGLLINAFAIFQALEHRRVEDLDRATRLLIGAYLALAAAFAAVQGGAAREVVTVAAAGACAVIAAYSVVSSVGLRIGALERATIARLGVSLAVLSMALVVSEVVWKYHYYPEQPGHPVVPTPTYEANERHLPRLDAVVLSDPEPYFRFIGPHWDLWSLYGERRGLIAFSLFYPPSLMRTLTYLSPRQATRQLRPQWVQLVPCRDFDPQALDLIGIKYMFCWFNGVQAPPLPANWQAVGREHEYILFRNTAYENGIKIFCNWRLGGPLWEREDVLSAFSGGVALVEPAAARLLPAPVTDCTRPARAPGEVALIEDRPGHMTLKVTSATPGIVFIPDNYDRGWRGSVNGIATPVVEVYGAYLGVPISAGQSTVTVEYRDPYFWAGVAVSILAALGLCGYAAAGAGGRRFLSQWRYYPRFLGPKDRVSE